MPSTTRRILFGAAAAAAAAACNGAAPDPAAPDAPVLVRADVEPGDMFTLAPGTAARIPDADLWVQFVEVTEDSRCAVDVQCVWAGDAGVVVQTVRAGIEMAWLLHTPSEQLGPRSVDVGGGWTLELTGLEPTPHSERRIAAEDYRATFRVTGG